MASEQLMLVSQRPHLVRNDNMMSASVEYESSRVTFLATMHQFTTIACGPMDRPETSGVTKAI